MQTNLRNKLKLALVLLLVVALLGAGLAQGTALAAPLPAAVNIDLCALPGSISLPGAASATIWGYALGDCSGSPTASLPGPTLNVNQGDVVTITLHNNLPEETALLFTGLPQAPDLTGAGASGGLATYTFTASNPGTYLYEAGLLPNAEHQVALGLYGALIVHPAAAGQAYADASTAFDEAALVLISELDPVLNASSNPGGFDMRNFKPTYWLINGKAYPDTAPIPTQVGHKVLLRYLNAGLQLHSMGVLGLNQTIIAVDGSPAQFSKTVVAETISPGQTLDAIVTIPSGAAVNGSQFAVYDASLLLHNNSSAETGGMLTFITVGTAGPGSGDTTGPASGAVGLTPNPANGAANVAITASISDVASGGSNVTAAEYFIDSTSGTPVALSGSFGSPTVNVTGTLTVAQMATLSSGAHSIYVHGRDAAGNWGAFNFASLILDKTGPATTGAVLSPNPTNGAVNVSLSVTGDDRASGNSNVVGGEYFIGATGANGTGLPLTVNSAAPIASLTASLTPAMLGPLADGAYVISAHSRDALGNWGAFATVTLNLDKTGPTASAVSAAPNPNNGTLGLNANTPAVRLAGTLTDPVSKITAAEGFIDTVGVSGKGFVFTATDGFFNSLSEAGYVNIPLTTINQLASGNHTLYVHGKDAAGNWGATTSTILVIDKLKPAVGGLTLTPAASNAAAVAISASASDTATGNSNLTAAEYFIDTAGANGAGIAMTLSPAGAPTATASATISAATVGALTVGTHTIYVNVKDAAGNWSTFVSASLVIDRTAPTLSGITLTPNSIPAGTASTALAVTGASDGAGGSGVTGGEYWFGTTDPAPGAGTAFSGLSATIPTSALAAGSYTVRARIRDAAGNWSIGTNGIRSATLTVTGALADTIFSDGFETGTLSPLTGWTSRSTTTTSRLNISAASALLGSYGLQAQGNSNNYVQYDFGTLANPAASTFDGRFYFNPHGNTDTNQDIFTGRLNSAGTTLFRVVYRWNGGSPQVQLQLGTGTVAANPWTSITNNASNRIEVVWQAGGTLQLFVGGSSVAAQTLTASANPIGSVRLGAVSTGGSSSILMYFDGFSAKRSVSPLYGP